jgi:hypothetical protein
MSCVSTSISDQSWDSWNSATRTNLYYLSKWNLSPLLAYDKMHACATAL